MRFLLISLIFLLNGIGHFINGQEESEVPDSKSDANVYMLGITPSAIFNKYPGIQLSHQLKAHEKVYFGLESAYLVSIYDEDFNGARGFRLRPSIQVKAIDSKSFRGYFGVFYNYRKTKAFREIESFRAGGSFIQIIDGHMDSRMRGFGLQIEFDFNKSLPNFSFSGGLGRGLITNIYSDPELTVNRWFEGNNVTSGRNREYLIIFTSLHYRLPIF